MGYQAYSLESQTSKSGMPFEMLFETHLQPRSQRDLWMMSVKVQLKPRGERHFSARWLEIGRKQHLHGRLEAMVASPSVKRLASTPDSLQPCQSPHQQIDFLATLRAKLHGAVGRVVVKMRNRIPIRTQVLPYDYCDPPPLQSLF